MSKERYRLITEYPKDEFFDNKQVVKFDSYEVIRTLNQQADKIADLEAKLVERKEFCISQTQSLLDINNALIEECEQLKQQLAEKEKGIYEELKNHFDNNFYFDISGAMCISMVEFDEFIEKYKE